MAYSEVQVANMALALIGAGRIAALAEISPEARNVNAIFALHRDEVLEAYPWNFAQGIAELAQLAEAPIDGFAYAYQLPADCIRPGSLNPTTEPFKRFGDTLHCNLSESVFLTYTKRETNAAYFTPAFVAAFSARMAADLAIMLPKDKQLAATMWDLYRQRLPGLQYTDNAGDHPQTEEQLILSGLSPYAEAR
jgi:hypothetical protein